MFGLNGKDILPHWTFFGTVCLSNKRLHALGSLDTSRADDDAPHFHPAQCSKASAFEMRAGARGLSSSVVR